MADPAVHVEGVVKRFGATTALAGVDLDVAEGTVLGLLGPNGAGKTTLVKILSTLIAPTKGTAKVAGCDGEAASALPALRSVRPTTIAKTPRKSIVTAKKTASVTRPICGQAMITMPTITSSAPRATPHQRWPSEPSARMTRKTPSAIR